VSAVEGYDLAQLKRSAQEALELHIAGMIANGDVAPRPRDIHAIGPEDVSNDFNCLTWLTVEADIPGGLEPQRVNVTFAPGLLRKIDRAADDEGRSRSGWLAEAAKERLARSPSAHR
jgi:HicB_like antitoxin of bacterial toxin-antitoxin system